MRSTISVRSGQPPRAELLDDPFVADVAAIIDDILVEADRGASGKPAVVSPIVHPELGTRASGGVILADMYSQVAEPLIAPAAVVDGDLVLTTAHRTVTIPAIWLRDNATDPTSRDPTSGQRLFDIVDVPPDIRVAHVTEIGRRLLVEFAPGGHRSEFDADTLLSASIENDPVDDRDERAKRLWRSAEMVADLPSVRWEDHVADPVPALRQIIDSGFVLLHHVPARVGQVVAVVETFGFVRETNYGRIFDVRVERDAANLAFTGRAISPHTDNPYRDPVPTVQVLHCLQNAAQGGGSGLVDGFAAAAHLREHHPAAFDILSSTPVAYRYCAGGARLTTTAPLIGLDTRGRIREIRFNNRSLEVPLAGPSAVRAFYDAYRVFAGLLYDPAAQLTLRLESGDCLMFDNTRTLHARTAFATMGDRHLQGAYGDLDSVSSTVRSREEHQR